MVKAVRILGIYQAVHGDDKVHVFDLQLAEVIPAAGNIEKLLVTRYDNMSLIQEG